MATAEQHFERAKKYAGIAESEKNPEDVQAYAALAAAHAAIAQADAVATAAHWLEVAAKK